MKSKEELEQLKTEFKSLSKKFAELNEIELKEVIGGMPNLFSVTRTCSCSFG